MIPNWLMSRQEIGSSAKLVYARLAQYAGKVGRCFPKQESIAREIGVSERTVRNAIEELEKNGLIIVSQVGLQMPNEYAFLHHEWMDLSAMDFIGDDFSFENVSDLERKELTSPERQNLPVNCIREENHQEENHTRRIGKGFRQQSWKHSEDVDKLYAIYPKKVGKGQALKAIAKALKDKPFDFLEQAVREYADAVRRNIESGAWEDMSFVPHPSTWFNGARYEDDRSTWLKKTVAKKRTAFEVNLLIKNTQEAIDTHPANPESISGVDRPTEEQKAALRELKTRLFNLREELNKIA